MKHPAAVARETDAMYMADTTGMRSVVRVVSAVHWWITTGPCCLRASVITWRVTMVIHQAVGDESQYFVDKLSECLLAGEQTYRKRYLI